MLRHTTEFFHKSVSTLSASNSTQNIDIMAVVVAQLVEQSIPTPGVRGLNPVIGILY